MGFGHIKIIHLLVILLFILPACKKPNNNMNQNENYPEIENNQLLERAVPLKKLRLDIQLNLDSVKITHYAVVKTSLGNFTIALFGEEAPKTARNFVQLAKQGYYNNTLIHRVAKNFLIQMGDGNTKYLSKKNEWGKGGKSIYKGYFPDEINPNSYIYRLGYVYGTVAMANNGPNKNLSQFFICLDEAQFLDKKYTIFGKVVEGFETLEEIEKQEIIPFKFDSLDGTPKKPIKVHSITIFKN